MLYFSYGSNMSIKRFKRRVSSARFVTVARLYGHVLRFHKIGMDGSGKCDAFETGRPEDLIYGVVYDMEESDKPELDRKEDLGRGYQEKTVKVVSNDLGILHVITYYAIRIDPDMQPFHWYKEHVIMGATENGLPEEYISTILEVDSVEDPENIRYQKEMVIYGFSHDNH